MGSILRSLGGRLGKLKTHDELEALLARLRQEDEDHVEAPVARAYAPTRAPSPARLTTVGIYDFKGIEHLSFEVGGDEAGTDQRRTPALMILGENATCKSSILEAIALALSDTATHRELALDPARLRLDRDQMGAPGSPQRHRARIELGFEDGSARQLEIQADRLRLSGADAAPPVFAFGAFRQYLEGKRRFSPDKTVLNLFRTDTILSNPEAWLLGLDGVSFNAVIRTLRPVFSSEGEFDVIRRDPGRRRCVVVHGLAAPEGGRVLTETPLGLVSSGFRSVLAMACDVLRGLMDRRINPQADGFEKARAIVLIDEIEAHLHPRWKIQIMQSLRAALPHVTFISTTHDPLCLRGMQNGDVRGGDKVGHWSGA